ncbi:MAG: VapE family protein [Azospirillaceae bacterium]
MSELARHMEAVARHLLGDPNTALSSARELRYGSHGSLSIDLKAGRFYDHEADQGGGVLDLIRRETGKSNGEAVAWLRSELGAELEHRTEPPARSGRIVARYPYQDAAGELLFEVVRQHPKTFRQRRPDGAGGWNWSVKGVEPVPYRLPEIAASSGTILIPGGEKDADNLAALGFTATTNPGGEGKWRPGFAKYFAGRRVVILADNDAAGEKHVERVGRCLDGVADSVRVVHFTELPDKGDVSDWIEARRAEGMGDAAIAEALRDRCRQAPAWEPAASEPAATVGDWYSRAQTNKDGDVRSNLANAMLALREDPAWRGVVAFDEMARTVMLQRPIPVHGSAVDPSGFRPRPLRDADTTAAQEWLQIAGLPSVAAGSVHQALEAVAVERAFHPLRDWLDGLVWDRVPRITGGTTDEGEVLDPWLSTYLGAEADDYAAEVGRMFLVSMIARIYDPGAQVDHVLVLEGPQGVRKSTACRILGGRWFGDSLPDPSTAGKDASTYIRGKWLVELGEVERLSKREAGALKAFITRPVEDFRPAYGRLMSYEPRTVVFIATTNENEYLRDATGGRRFWPVRVGHIDTDALARDRAQLLAEAVHRYRQGERWWPDSDFESRFIQPAQEERYEGDAWEEAIADFLRGERRVTTLQVARQALHFETARVGTADQRRISAILERLGWRRRRTDGVRHWVPGNSAAVPHRAALSHEPNLSGPGCGG